jgi:glutamate--cysteine ligase catalytic subunit
MARAHHRDSVRQENFHFRVGSESRLMSMNEIINGTNDFLGLVPLVQQYFNEREEIDSDTRITVQQYLSLISKRAAGISFSLLLFSPHCSLFEGILLTDASWIRQFVTSHPDYKQDSVVSDTVQHDLIWKIIQIVNGHEPCPSLVHSRMQTNTHLHPN